MPSKNDTWKRLSASDRRRNSYGINVSDTEKEKLEEKRISLGMSRNQFVKAALEMFAGCTIFRPPVKQWDKRGKDDDTD